MLETSARLLELLALLQTRRSWTGPDLSERLQVNARTLRRDIERLRALGYDVDAVSGPGGGYRLSGGTALAPLLLTEDEAVTAAVALRTAVEGADADDKVLGLLVKLDQLLPERLRSRVAALHSQTVSMPGSGPRVDVIVLSRLAAACRDSDAVRIRYQPRFGESAERTVHPLRLVHTGNRRWYLVAWDPERSGWRTLRVDRIGGIVDVGPRVVRPDPPPDVEDYVSRSIAHAPYPCRGTLELAGALDTLAARIPPWIGVLSAVSDGVCRLEIGGWTWDAVVVHAVLSGVEFRVIEPPELADAIADVERRLARARTDLSARAPPPTSGPPAAPPSR